MRVGLQRPDRTGTFPGVARGETKSPCTVGDVPAAPSLAEATGLSGLSGHGGRPVHTMEVVR